MEEGGARAEEGGEGRRREARRREEEKDDLLSTSTSTPSPLLLFLPLEQAKLAVLAGRFVILPSAGSKHSETKLLTPSKMP